MDKGIIIVGIFVVGLLAGGVFLLQSGNDTEGVQFIEVPSQPQQVVIGDREDIPEPNEGVGRGRQAVELPEGEKILLSPEEESEIAEEEAKQAAIEAEREELANRMFATASVWKSVTGKSLSILVLKSGFRPVMCLFLRLKSSVL